jgi:hypothetical protein
MKYDKFNSQTVIQVKCQGYSPGRRQSCRFCSVFPQCILSLLTVTYYVPWVVSIWEASAREKTQYPSLRDRRVKIPHSFPSEEIMSIVRIPTEQYRICVRPTGSPCSWALLQKARVLQQLKNVSNFPGTWRLATVFIYESPPVISITS